MNNRNKNKKNMSASMLSTFIVCALLLIFGSIAIFLSGFDWHFDGLLGGFTQIGHSAQISGNISKVDKAEDWDYFDDTIMVGDSITYGMASYGYLSFDHVFAKIGLHQGTALTSKCVYTSKTQGYTISDALSVAKPSKIYVTLGINAIYNYKSDSFYDNYRALLAKIKKASPDSIIIIQSIFPVTETWAINNGKPNCNKYIAYANQKLSELAKDENCYFLHTYEALTDQNGFLQSQFSGDGIHLSRKGYEAVFNYILTHPVKGNGKFTHMGAITPPAPQVSTTSKVTMPNLENISSDSSSEGNEAPVNSDSENSSDTSSDISSDISSSAESSASSENKDESSSQEDSSGSDASLPTSVEPESSPSTENPSSTPDTPTQTESSSQEELVPSQSDTTSSQNENNT